jgi:TPR repeat protein
VGHQPVEVIAMRPTRTKRASDANRVFREAEQEEERGNYRAAFLLLLDAAQLDHHMSQLHLGNFYASGCGTRKDLKKAAFWYKRAHRNGNNDGALNLAIDRREQGNFRSAVTWFKKAIAMKNGDAYVELAKLYLSKKNGKERASDLLKQAIRLDRDQISDHVKDKARSLLKMMGK